MEPSNISCRAFLNRFHFSQVRPIIDDSLHQECLRGDTRGAEFIVLVRFRIYASEC